MCGELPWNGFIEDDLEKFAVKAVELYTNEEIWKQAQQHGIEIINTMYDKELLENKFLRVLQQISSNLEQHRNNNFTGKMLLHHSLQSTKYMSKWIEEKNKK